LADWPSQSPDANPIENVWAYIKQKLRGKRVFTLKQLSREIRCIWKALPLEYAENLVDSMPRRYQTIIDADDGWTRY
ncbi:Transposable element Tcb2 transposase, partial [Harpegnathos saltator]